MVFVSGKERTAVKTQPIKNFLGLNKTSNILDQPLGQLVINKNLEYFQSGSRVFLRTKRGSTLLKDITDRARGAGNYFYNLTDNFLVWVDVNGNLKVLNETTDVISTLTTGLTTGIQNHFVMYGAQTSSALYIANNTDGVRKVSGAVPAHATITAPNLNSMAFSTLGGRMFGANKHTIYWSEIQIDPLILTNLENWAIGTNNTEVSPDDGTGFVAQIELSSAMFYFKDTGIWAHLNIDQSPTDWFFPKMNSDVGTRSPKTVKAVKYGDQTGIIFLASDKTLRFFTANVIRNAGKLPSVNRSDALQISFPIQDELDNISDAALDECSAVYHDRYYILNIPGKDETTLTKTFVVDTAKLLQLQPGEEAPQPFIFESENMNYTDMLVRRSNNKLFGFHKDGYINELFVDDTFTEEVPTRIDATGKLAIEYEAFTGWFQFSERQMDLLYAYFNWNSLANTINSLDVFVNSFVLGADIPEFSDGFSQSIQPNSDSQTFWNQTLWNQSIWNALDTFVSQNVSLQGRGHYFLFGFKQTVKDKPVSVFGFEPIFRVNREDPLGRRF